MNSKISGRKVHEFRHFGISEEWPSFFVLTFLNKEEVLQVTRERMQIYSRGRGK